MWDNKAVLTLSFNQFINFDVLKNTRFVWHLSIVKAFYHLFLYFLFEYMFITRTSIQLNTYTTNDILHTEYTHHSTNCKYNIHCWNHVLFHFKFKFKITETHSLFFSFLSFFELHKRWRRERQSVLVLVWFVRGFKSY